ncbi:MAG TPA: UDP-glucose/GDP-mannose dehydrogenase family protein [Chthoniobacterales bacterium]|nr:UDP-glucose/GDP-mannose dehydrogenase family protein [Chthoniobacterales bacterium]
MKLSIIGTGYVGLVTGVCLSEKGHSVVCVDLDESKVNQINAGKTPIYEPGLPELLERQVAGGRLRATTDLEQAVRESSLTLIAVGTPFNRDQIDLTYVRACAAQIGAALRKKKTYHVVVVKSTVVPGTTDDVVKPILEKESGKRAGRDFGVGMNPEFLSEGEAVHDFMRPDRIVLGGVDERTRKSLAMVYRSFDGVPILRTTNKTAEMIKYTSNALLATLISFSNEIGNLCSDLGGVDCVDVMQGVHLSQYLTPTTGNGRVRAPIASFVAAGCGFGGSCLPKDVKALIARGNGVDSRMGLLKEVIRINEDQPGRMIELLKTRIADLRGVSVAVLGLAFKPETDDLRESPAIRLIDLLLKEGARVLAYDPVAMPAARRTLTDREVSYCESLEETVKRAKAILLVTSWKEFERVPKLMTTLRRHPILVDGRRQLDKQKVKNYLGVGL